MPFTDRAKLQLEFRRIYEPGVGCLLKTKINPLNTKPADLQKGLVVYRANPYSVQEKLLRIVTETDLAAALPTLPAVVDRFKSATYAALVPAVGDIIHVGDIPMSYTVPETWKYLHLYAPGWHTYTVVDASDPNNLLVTPAFPDYGEAIDFYVTRPLSPDVIPQLTPATDGVADRDYSATPLDWVYVAAEHYDFLGPDAEYALNLIDALRAQAQSIVDALNQDSFSGDSVEIFE